MYLTGKRSEDIRHDCIPFSTGSSVTSPARSVLGIASSGRSKTRSGVGIVENNWLTDEGKSPVQRRRGSQVRTKLDRVRGLVLSVLVADWES